MPKITHSPLTIQKVRDLITEKHNTLLDENDPILMLVTMHRAFLDEYELMLNQQAAKTEEHMNEHVKAFATEVRKSTNILLSKAVKANVENCIAEIGQHQEVMSNFLSTIKTWSLFTGIMLILSVATTLSVLVWGS
ncbi:MAG: hypothetical protein BA863_15805 [Desulfovibrio sp. S3730MH75]|nr:MAG: hypothetical protein BA863_15805 [Desulfovibrio sp. S3730MH75]